MPEIFLYFYLVNLNYLVIIIKNRGAVVKNKRILFIVFKTKETAGVIIPVVSFVIRVIRKTERRNVTWKGFTAF